MGIKKFKPTSPGSRLKSGFDFSEITTDSPYKPLLCKLKRGTGRNNQGRITAYHRGGGHKRAYRLIDFKRNKFDVKGIVETIEYDPNRTARIALIKYMDGDRRYILATAETKVGDTVVSGMNIEILPGNATFLKNIPLGTNIHNLELYPGNGGKLLRSAGSYGQLVAKDEKYCQVKLPSGEVRYIRSECMATIGQVGNIEQENIRIGKAGRKRWLGKRPIVRGVAMNPVDHPLGGGEGKSSGGRHPVTPWGKPEGVKTRRNKATDKYIIKKRK